MIDRPWVALGWRCGQLSGWGQFGIHFARSLHEADYRVMLLAPLETAGVLPLDRPLLQSLFNPSKQRTIMDAEPGWGCVALTHHMEPRPPGTPKHVRMAGIIFIEDTDAIDAAKLNAYDLIVAGCRWTERVLREKGVSRVVLAHQGYDARVFFPGPGRGRQGPMRVFSGGKLEFRKGQDIAIEAFKRFRRTPEGKDAVLVCAWDNQWPATMDGIPAAGYVTGLPAVSQGRLEIGPWLMQNGLPEGSFIDCGRLTPPQLAQVLRSCTVGIFPNRAESGTNLVLVEAMGSGLPCIASGGHGHDDVVERSIPSTLPVPTGCRLYKNTEGWSEVDPDAVVAMLRDPASWPTAPSTHASYWDWSVRGPAMAEAIVASAT